VWFTESHGRVHSLIRGSQRPKSWMLGQYDLFYTCELLFYLRAADELHPLRECAPLRRRPGFRNAWRACAGASFVADLLYRVSLPRLAARDLFHLATLTLDCLEKDGAHPALLFWFELQVLRDLGLSPNLDMELTAPFVFDHAAGRLRSADQTPRESTHPLSPGARALLDLLSRAEDPSRLHRLKIHADQIREIRDLLDRFSRWHLDLALPSRALALECMTRPAA